MTVTLTPTLTTENTAVVEAKVVGNTYEIASYKFEGGVEDETKTSNYTTFGYTYRGLIAGRSYNLKVTVTDVKGNSVTSSAATATATYNGYVKAMNPTDTSKTGKTIDYIPAIGRYSEATASNAGVANETFTTEKNIGWRIWGEDENNIYIISDMTTTKSLALQGVAGANNGLLLMHGICRNCYSGVYEGMYARSLIAEDIYVSPGTEAIYTNKTYGSAEHPSAYQAEPYPSKQSKIYTRNC